jgi:TPR repeat protein
LYDEGQGVPQDYGAAISWYRKAHTMERVEKWQPGRAGLNATGVFAPSQCPAALRDERVDAVRLDEHGHSAEPAASALGRKAPIR